MIKGTVATLLGGVVSQAAAIACWYGLREAFGIDALKFWFNLILPFGAFMLGLLGAIGFAAAGRAVKRPSTTGLAVAAMGISLLAYGAIRFLGYWTLVIDGVAIRNFVDFGTYLTATLGHGRMDISHGGGEVIGSLDLGAFGYAMEAIQAAAYAVCSYGLVRQLPRAVRCEACNVWMREGERGKIQVNDQARFLAMHQRLPEGGASRLAVFRAMPSDEDSHSIHAVRFAWRIAECPNCSNAALAESGDVHNGKYYAPVSVLTRVTLFDRRRTSPPPPAEPPVEAQPRAFGRRVIL